jgi:hypothetical protein
MSFYKAQVELERDTNAAEDRTVNAFHFQTDNIGTDSQELDDIVAGLTTLYNVLDGSLSRELSGAWRIKIYDLEDPPQRVPVRDTSPAALSPAASALPSQLAMIVNYEAPGVSGFPQARRRGRLFIGPLSSSQTDITGEDARASADVIAVGNAFGAIIPVFPSPSSGSLITWMVFSRRNAYDELGLPYDSPEPTYTVAALEAGMSLVTRVKIPNVLGVQRRRRVGTGITVTTFT